MMKIMVTFEADSAERLREQLVMFLEGPKPPLKEFIAERTPAQQLFDRAKEIAKARKAEAPEPKPQLEPPVEEPEPEPETEEETVTPEAAKAVELMKLKEQQLSRLRDLFNTGKGPLVRTLLAKYGNGAKVFPEVPADQFPAIKIELDRELGVQ